MHPKRRCCSAIFPFRFETRVFVVASLVVASLALAPQAGAQSTVPDIPSVEGPITGPGPIYPGLRPLTPGTEPQDYGYVTEDFFVSGTTLVGGVAQPYTTRMLGRQPKNPKRFSGIVVAADIPRRPHP